ncbi:MAG: hypothetical protein LBQ31_09855 [Bacteroidales bacterium]|nr:hypothetical protein [Bacteroidales bacterium]
MILTNFANDLHRKMLMTDGMAVRYIGTAWVLATLEQHGCSLHWNGMGVRYIK